MRIAIIGAGYVGLVSAACFANAGHSATCIDSDRKKIHDLKRGILPIYEPGLEAMVLASVEAERLTFSDDLATGVRHADAVFIAVGTPARPGDGRADLSQVYAASAAIAPALPRGALVVLKSTVPVGTGDEVERIISEAAPHLEFNVASNPEFLRAGAAIADFTMPDRVVIGIEDEIARQKSADIYRPVLSDNTPILYTSRRTAELVKYASNAFLATKIAFINEVAALCERVGADVEDVGRGMGMDQRIGAQFLSAGPGFGGSCFPKDARALVKMGEDHEAPMRIAETVLAVNDARKRSMARKVAATLGGSLRGKTIALFGLTFKPDTDDMREAPSLTLAAGLTDLHAAIRAYDPAGMEQAKPLLPDGLTCCRSAYDAAEGADAIVVVTEWQQFRGLDLNRLRRSMRAPVMIDLRNMYSADEVMEHGFFYHRIGAPQRSSASSHSVASWSAASRQRGRVEGATPRVSGSAPRSKHRKELISETEATSAG
jgi:UDPglucose 6-dehydrogenase